MKIRKLSQKGFTLVELLIVIVIIGILATIGFVAYSGAQNKAKHSKATATLSQVKSKLGEYYADNNAYPSSKADVVSYLNDPQKGNSPSLAGDLGDGAFTYSASNTTSGSPTACTTAANDCNTFTVTAAKSYWGGSNPSTDESVTN